MPRKHGYGAISQADFFQTQYLLKAEKRKRFASMKEPDTAYSNSFTRYGLLFVSNSEILQAVDCSLLARYIEYMTST